MKSMRFSAASVGLGGAAFFGMSDSPDFDREVSRPPLAVYAAFSRLAQEGSVTRRETSGGKGYEVTYRTEKTRGEKIRFQISVDDRQVLDVDLDFEPVDGGQSTRVTAEMDVDASAIGSALENEAGVAFSRIPDSFLDRQFASYMEGMIKDVEAGRPLRPLGLEQTGVRRHQSSSENLDERRLDSYRAQRQAVRPMVRATPMIDPNQAASNHREGRNAHPQNGGWGR